MRNTLVWVGIVVIVALVAWMLFGNPSFLNQFEPEPPDTDTSAQQPVFSYPDDFGLTYVHAVDWPPTLTELADTVYTCTQAGEEVERAGKTEEIVVNGRTYCKTLVSEGAAGSTYHQYAYVFEKDGKVYDLTFTTRMPQCLNYDEPEQADCTNEQEAFDIDVIVDEMMQTLH